MGLYGTDDTWKSSTLTLVKKVRVLVNIFQSTVYNSTKKYLFFVFMGYVLILTSTDNVIHWPLFIRNHSGLTTFSLRLVCCNHIRRHLDKACEGKHHQCLVYLSIFLIWFPSWYIIKVIHPVEQNGNSFSLTFLSIWFQHFLTWLIFRYIITTCHMMAIFACFHFLGNCFWARVLPSYFQYCM